MSGPVLGIDLGTTNSVVAVADGGQTRVLTDPEGRRIVPSVVAFREDGRTLVGYEAREMRLTDAANTVYAVKRLIGRPFDSPEVARARERFAFEIVESKHGGSIVQVRKGKYALAEISALVLRELRRIAQLALGEPCDRAVVTVPANFNELQRSATKAAGKVAGLDVLRILNEPTAAALAYGYGHGGEAQKVAVYDLGGGTFDITILELEDDVFEVLATAGDTFLGGEDIDGTIAEAMCDVFRVEHGWDPRTDKQAFERLKAAGEWAKCQLTTEDAVELTVEGLTQGRQGKPCDLRYPLDRPGLEALTAPWLERSFAVCDEALKTAGLKASDVDSVVLVGGSTRMPYCRRLVEQYFQSVPRTDLDPDMVVAQGAAIHGFALGGPWKPKAPPAKPRRTSQLGRVALKRITQAELVENQGLPPKRATLAGVPRQPAFAPPEVPQARPPVKRPTRDSLPAFPVPDLPLATMMEGPAVVAQPVVAVRTPRTTLDVALDDLSPPDELASRGGLDDLAPPELDPEDDLLDDLAPPPGTSDDDLLDDLAPPAFAQAHDPLSDLAPDDPFASPSQVPQPSLSATKPPMDSGFDVSFDEPFDAPAPDVAPDLASRWRSAPPGPPEGLPAPGQKKVQSREATAPFSLQKHAAPPPPPKSPSPKSPAPKSPQRPPPPPPAAARAPKPPPFDAAQMLVELEEESFFPSDPPSAPRAPVQAAPEAPAIAVERAQAVVAMPAAPPPILMDVTPHSLGLETAGGYCRRLIMKNAPLPTEQMRNFTTALDDQREVAVRICQGESEQFDQNEVLGEVVLDQLPAHARGQLQIEVAFILDADGTLAVEAKESGSGRVQRTHINLRGGLSDDDIAAMRLRLDAEELPL